MTVKVFFCYAREDEEYLKRLKAYLKPLQRLGLIDIWHDRDISAGKEWELEINKHLDEAQIILLLISPDFMDSDYCYGTEMKRAIERHERKEASVIPIILRPIYWQGTLGKLQALPTDAKPIIDRFWHNIDEALYDVAEGIRKVIDEIAAKPAPLVINTAQQTDRNKLDPFTEQAKKVLTLATGEAQRLNHHEVDTEHLLLGLVLEGKGVAAKVLSNLGIELDKVRSAVDYMVKRGDRIVLGEIGLSTQSKKVIELSVDEARRLNNRYISPEHFLLALVREDTGIASKLLTEFGITIDKARAETIRVLTYSK